MISLSKMMLQVLTETMSFADLLNNSDPARVDRATHVKSRSLKVTTMDGQEAWIFSYKSDPDWTTTEKRWQGYVQFLKEAVGPNDNAEDLQCMVDCNCPDYRYRWAYRNAEAGAGEVGSNSWNGNNGNAPKNPSNDLGTGLCKHLISLGRYLKTKIEPTAPEEPEEPKDAEEVPETPDYTKPIGSVPMKSTAGDAPEEPVKKKYPTFKPSFYSDSRSGDLMENNTSLKDKIQKFVESNPNFEVPYD
jgi:hypothetical protein